MDGRKKLRELSRKALLLDRLEKLMQQRKEREHEKGKKPAVVDRETTEFLHRIITTANKRESTRKAGRRPKRAKTVKRMV